MLISTSTRSARDSRTRAPTAPQQHPQQQHLLRSDAGRHQEYRQQHPQYHAPTHAHNLDTRPRPPAPTPLPDSDHTIRPPQPAPLVEGRRQRVVCVDTATASHTGARESPKVCAQGAPDQYMRDATARPTAPPLSAIAYDDDDKESVSIYADDSGEYTDEYTDDDDDDEVVVEDEDYCGKSRQHGNNDHDSVGDGGGDDDSESEDEEEDDAGSRAMQDAIQREAVLVLCREWHKCRAELQAKSSRTKALCKERAKIIDNITSYMRGQNIGRACGSIPRRRRVMVTVRPGRRSYSTTDQTLSDAIYRRASIKLADACMADPRGRSSSSSSSSSSSISRKRTLPDDAPPAPRAKHHKSGTPSQSASTDNSDSSDGYDHEYEEGETNVDGYNDNRGIQHDDINNHDDNDRDKEEEDNDESAVNNDDNDAVDNNGNEQAIVPLRDALARLVVRAIREAQNAITVDRRTVAVQVYDRASRYSYEPIAIPQEEDEGKGKEKDDGKPAKGTPRAAGPITIYPELPPIVAAWAARLHEIDEALAEIRAASAPVRARMAALTTDLAAPAITAQGNQTAATATTTTTTTATTTTAAKKTKKSATTTGKSRAEAAEDKRRLHEAHARLRNDVRAYLAAHPADANAPPGVAVQFASATPNTPPAAYRVRAVLRIRRGTVAVRDYEGLAAEAAREVLAAAGVDSDEPYSPAVAERILSTDGARKALFDALKAAMDRHRNARAREPVRGLAITKISGTGRGANAKGDPPC
nr:hypothetical protein [Pandoravirus massiliensis]